MRRSRLALVLFVLTKRLESATEADDVIIGTNSYNRIYGYGGDDIICARGGMDIV